MKYIAVIAAIIMSATAVAGGPEDRGGSTHHNSFTVMKPTITANPTANAAARAAALAAAKAKAQAASLAAGIGVGEVANSTSLTIQGDDYSDMVPSVNAYAPAPTVPCFQPGGLSLNFSGFGGGLGGGTIDKGCEMREFVRLGQSDTNPSVRAMASQVLLEKLHGYMAEPEKPESQDTASTNVDAPDVMDDSLANLRQLGIL